MASQPPPSVDLASGMGLLSVTSRHQTAVSVQTRDYRVKQSTAPQPPPSAYLASGSCLILVLGSTQLSRSLPWLQWESSVRHTTRPRLARVQLRVEVSWCHWSAFSGGWQISFRDPRRDSRVMQSIIHLLQCIIRFQSSVEVGSQCRVVDCCHHSPPWLQWRAVRHTPNPLRRCALHHQSRSPPTDESNTLSELIFHSEQPHLP